MPISSNKYSVLFAGFRLLKNNNSLATARAIYYNLILPEEKEQQKSLKRWQKKDRKIIDASAAAHMRHFMQPRTTVIEKVNKRTRKLKEVKERRRRARRKRKQLEYNDESITWIHR